MRCPFCQVTDTKVIDTAHDNQGGIRRRRQCENCHQRFSTYERVILSTPLIVKRDGTREEFSLDKLKHGIKTACTKRPITAEMIDQLANHVETELQQLGKSEISSRVIGDKVIDGLKDLDLIAYIRYASVYLQLKDLHAVRDEIDTLLEA